MNLLFVHDHKLRIINDSYYTLGGLSDSVTQRYTNIFSKMTIICRSIPKQDSDNQLFKIKNSRVEIKAFNGLGLLLSKEKKAIIETEVKVADAIIVRLPSVIGLTALKYARKHNKHYMVEVVGCAWDGLWNHSIKGKLMAPFMFLRARYAIKKSPYALYVTKSFLQKRYPCKGKIESCSDVELNEINDEILLQRLKRVEKIQRKIILGTLGAVDVKYKGHRDVIQAISILNKQGYNFEYEIVGSGDQSTLREVAKTFGVTKQVKFLGILPHNEVFEWIDTIDLYIQPSKQEGLPRAVIEAMSRACPIIGSNAGGIPELISSSQIFKKGNVDLLCNILANISKSELKNQCEYNFYNSKEYKKDVLNKRRVDFYTYFKENIN